MPAKKIIMSIQDSVIKNKDLMIKRRYGEATGNVVQERHRRLHSRSPQVKLIAATQLTSARVSLIRSVRNPSLVMNNLQGTLWAQRSIGRGESLTKQVSPSKTVARSPVAR